MADRASRVIFLLSLLFLFLVCVLLPDLRHLEDLTTDWRQSLRYAVKVRLGSADTVPGGRQPISLGISDDLCLIGIDEPTLTRFGKFGSGSWAVRAPFSRLLPVIQDYVPSVLAFDILFRPAGEEASYAADASEKRTRQQLFAALRAWESPEAPPPDDRLLLLITQFAAAQAEYNLAGLFSELANPPSPEKKPVPIIAAFTFEGIDPTRRTRPWSPGDVVGLDENGPSEEHGAAIPYLRDLAIPEANLRHVPARYPYAVNAVLPAPAIRNSVLHGFINVPRDADGLIRRVPLVLGFAYRNPVTGVTKHAFVPSFALLAVLQHLRLSPADVAVDFGHCLTIRRGSGQAIRVPVDSAGRLYLNYHGRITDFRTVSMLQFLSIGEHDLAAREGLVRLSPGEQSVVQRARNLVRDRLTIVGLTATGTTDIGPCPVDPNTPYVHVHLTAASNILTGRCLTPMSWPGQLLLLAGLFMVYTLVVQGCGIRVLVPVTLAVLAVYAAAAFLLVYADLLIIPVVAPAAYLGGTFGAVLIFRYSTEERAKHRIRKMFSTMVSGEVLRYMEEHPESFSLAGRRVEASVMFSDLAGFTSISERISPEEVTAILNRYFDAMTEIIIASGGYLDKFEGDAIMAAWGVPYPLPNHARNACLAVLEQARALARLRPEIRQRYGIELRARFGLDTGLVIAGNMGSAKRFQYTVVGETANQAARLEPVNKDYGTEIIIGEGVYAAVRDVVRVRLLDKLVVAGMTRPICIYELLGRSDEPLDPVRQEMTALYEAALRRIWERQWDEAEALLRRALAAVPEERASLLLLERVAIYRRTPPPAAWRGEVLRASKE